MAYKEEIKTALKRMLQNEVKTNLFLSTVVSVDVENRMCAVQSVVDNNSTTIPRVNLSTEANDGFIKIPKVDSTILVMLSQTDREYYMIMCEDLQDIFITVNNHSINVNQLQVSATTTVFNGGNNKGLVKVSDLVDKLNKIEQQVNKINVALQGWTPVSSDGGAALKTFYNTLQPQDLIQTVIGDLENEKVTH